MKSRFIARKEEKKVQTPPPSFFYDSLDGIAEFMYGKLKTDKLDKDF
jgi:hypothetical protein